MKRARRGTHLVLLVLVGSHLTQTVYYLRMAVAAMEARDQGDDQGDDVELAAEPAAEPEPAAAAAAEG